MSKIDEEFAALLAIPTDIQEHMKTLSSYAEQCETIIEFGVRSWISTVALLHWKPEQTEMVSYDIETNPDVWKLIQITKEEKIKWTFVLWDTREINIPLTDLLFIDTLHNYDLLKTELERHASKVKKFIIFHDTTTFGEHWETQGHDWLNKAISEYQQDHPERVTKEVYTNNNWLTVLERTLHPKQPITVYTAIYWWIDVLKTQPTQDIKLNWVCFTDNPNLECEPGAKEQWEIKVIPTYKHLHPRMQAKYFRTHPYNYIDSDTVVYVDWSCRFLRSDSIRHLTWEMLDKSDILTAQHPDRNCVADEANFCFNIPKYRWLPMSEQVRHYFSRWYPKQYWLTWTWILITKKSNEKIRSFLRDWRVENLVRWYQDQLSFDPLVWKRWVKRQWLQENLWDNQYFNFSNPHKTQW